MQKKMNCPLGFGLGLRPEHYDAILAEKPAIDWLEILTENYLVPGGKPLYYLEKISAMYPIVMHGVSMSIGSSDPLDWDYLHDVKRLAEKTKAKWISDHLCWTGIHGKNAHDLLPLPYTEETIEHIVKRIQQIQDFLGQRILLENVSSYLNYQQSHLTEWDFYRSICERADCFMLLDINNIYVSAKNHDFNPMTYLNAMPVNRVKQIHLAGHSDMGDYIIDTHDHEIVDPVWNLYASALKRFGFVATMIERDDNIPPLNILLTELNIARKIANELQAA
jgi:uncharacterized protein (UPF0276 family)